MTAKSTTRNGKKASDDNYDETDLSSDEYENGYWIRYPAGRRTASRQDYEVARVFADGVIEFGYWRADGSVKLVESIEAASGTEIVPRRAEYTRHTAYEPTRDGGSAPYDYVRCEACGKEVAPPRAAEIVHEDGCPDAREVL
jgi:hypothetical protein